MDKEAENKFRRELESAGEAQVRADFYSGGGSSTGGEDRRKVIRAWLRENEIKREAREQRVEHYGWLTFWVAIGALIASIAGVVATVLHK